MLGGGIIAALVCGYASVNGGVSAAPNQPASVGGEAGTIGGAVGSGSVTGIDVRPQPIGTCSPISNVSGCSGYVGGADPFLKVYQFLNSGSGFVGLPPEDLRCTNYVSGNWVCTGNVGGTGTNNGSPTSVATPYYPNGFGGTNASGAGFGGTADFFDYGNVLNPSDMTVCWSAKPTATGFWGLFSKDDASAATSAFDIDLNSSTAWRFDVYSGATNSALTFGTVSTLGSWDVACCSYHFVTNGTSTMRCNLNGTAQTTITTAAGPLNSSTDTLQIGNDQSAAGRKMNGQVSRVSYWQSQSFGDAALKFAVLGMMGALGSGGDQLQWTRSSVRTCTVASGTYTLANNVPCIDANGLSVEPPRINLFLNSGAPATQTITVATGGLAAWETAGTSMALAVGTATVTGLPCTATPGSPCQNLNVTGAGTITATISGAVTFAQVEQANGAGGMCISTGCLISAEIDTAGATVSRAQESGQLAAVPFLDSGGGSCVTLLAKSIVAPGFVLGTSSQKFLFEVGNTNTIVQSFDGTNNPIATTSDLTTSARQVCTSWSANGNKLASFQVGGAVASTAYAGTIGAAGPILVGGLSNANVFHGHMTKLCFTNVGAINGTSSGVAGCPP